MKKGVFFKWDEACRNAFKCIKVYWMKLPVLIAPVPGRSLILYVAAQERSVGVLLARENNGGKNVLGAIFAIQKLKHYFKRMLYVSSKK